MKRAPYGSMREMEGCRTDIGIICYQGGDVKDPITKRE